MPNARSTDRGSVRQAGPVRPRRLDPCSPPAESLPRCERSRLSKNFVASHICNEIWPLRRSETRMRPMAETAAVPPAPETSPVTIKKYANRRLYNTASSSYVTLEHLCQMVKEGVDFVVYDAKTGEDITRQVLTQIIVEEEAKGQNLLPI